MPPWDVICISPHADDAALSVGGTLAALAAAGRRVLVVTVCTAPPVSTPFADELHRAMGLSAADLAAVRRAEDQRALARLGVMRVEAGLADAIYRMPAYDSREMLLGGRPVANDPLADDLRAYLSAYTADLWLAPLGLGHVDHVLCARAGAVHYEDFPYAMQDPAALAARTRGMRGFDLGVTPDTDARIAAVREYRSQVPMLFGDDARMEAAVRAHAVERLWHAPDPPP